MSCEDHADHIYVLEKDLAESGYPDEKIRLLLVSYANYANKCVGDTLVPEFCFAELMCFVAKGKSDRLSKSLRVYTMVIPTLIKSQHVPSLLPSLRD